MTATAAYLIAGFPAALREVTGWLWRPPVWWLWLIAAPLYPITAHIAMWMQFRYGDHWWVIR